MTRIILIFAFFLFNTLTFSQTTEEAKYTLTIKKGKGIKENKQTFWVIPTTLTNKTNGTLRYFSMSCSWQDFYSVDNKKLQLEMAECNKNIPTILTLEPGQSKTIEIRLLTTPTMNASKLKFKIGLNLMKASKAQNPLDLDFKEEAKKNNVIWSNIISM